MDKNTLQTLLTSIQYLSIVLSGILGMFGVIFNYKDKETGKLTRSGKIALSFLIISLGLGLTSKIVEQNIKQKAEQTEATKARIAAEQSLKVSYNVERVVNAIQTMSVNADFEIDFNSPLFEEFKNDIKQRIGNSWNDRGFSPEELANKIKSPAWKQTIRDLTFAEPVLNIYPKGSVVPDCIDIERHAPLELSIPLKVDNFEIPQQDELLQTKYFGPIDIQHRDSTQVLSLVDFKGATIVGYMFLATKEEIPTIDKQTTSKKPASFFEKHFPVAAWKFNSISFYFDNGRRIFPKSFEMKYDKCTGQPFFVVTLPE